MGWAVWKGVFSVCGEWGGGAEGDGEAVHINAYIHVGTPCVDYLFIYLLLSIRVCVCACVYTWLCVPVCLTAGVQECVQLLRAHGHVGNRCVQPSFKRLQ